MSTHHEGFESRDEITVDIGPKSLERRGLASSKKEAEEVNWRTGGDGWRATGSYSSINEKDKYSEGYEICIGVALVGRKKGSGEPISLLTHFTPNGLIDAEGTMFRGLAKAIDEFAAAVEQGTADVVIFGGGAYTHGADTWNVFYKDTYLRAVTNIIQHIEKSLGVTEPRIAALPVKNAEKNKVHVLLDTKKRKLYLVRPKQKDEKPEDLLFPVSELEDRMENW